MRKFLILLPKNGRCKTELRSLARKMIRKTAFGLADSLSKQGKLNMAFGFAEKERTGRDLDERKKTSSLLSGIQIRESEFSRIVYFNHVTSAENLWYTSS
jgi:hypothetical protein